MTYILPWLSQVKKLDSSLISFELEEERCPMGRFISGKSVFNIEGAINDPIWKCKPLWLMHIIAVCILYLVPDNILGLIPLLALLVRFVAGFAPAIDMWGKWSDFPQAAQLYMVICILSIPIQTLLIARHKPTWKTYVERVRKGLDKSGLSIHIVALIFCCLIVGAIALFFFVSAIPYSPNPYCPDSKPKPYRYKWAMAMLGIGGSFGISGLISTYYYWLKNFRAIYFNQQGGNKWEQH